MNTLKEAQAILKAIEEGKTIQIKCGDGKWEDFGLTTLPNFGNATFRIKPSTRLLTVDELPDVIWLKSKLGIVMQVVAIRDGNLVVGETSNRGACIQFLKDEGVLWSASRKGPWNSFETKEVKP